MLSGLDLNMISSNIKLTSKKFIVGGGLKDIEDIKGLKEIYTPQLEGVIAGKAFYVGSIDLKEADKLLELYMLKKRIIPCLDVKDGRVVKGINFIDLVDAGDPVEQAKFYSENGADEICFLDITASLEERDTMLDVLKKQLRKFLFL